MSVVAGLVGVLLLGTVSILAVFVGGMRAGWPPVVDNVRRINRLRLNPEQLKTAGTPGAFAGVLRHTGRVSGGQYETPLGIVPTEDGFVIALVYGQRTDWLKNVLASGTASIVHEGVTYEVDRPEVVPVAGEASRFTATDRLSQRILGTDACLRVHRVDAAD